MDPFWKFWSELLWAWALSAAAFWLAWTPFDPEPLLK